MRGSATIRKERVIEHRWIDDAVVVVKATTTETVLSDEGEVGFARPAAPQVYQFFTTPDGFEGFVKTGVIGRKLPLFFCSQAIRDHLRTKGFFYIGEEKAPEVSHDVYDQGETFGFAPYNVLRLDLSSHRVYDIRDRPVPTAMLFEYIRGHMVDGRYDLVKAAAHLMTRDDVVLFHGRALDKAPVTMPQDAIQDVPHYNAEKGCRQFLQFRYMPTDVDFQRIYAEVRRTGGRWDLSEGLYRAVFDLDLLGLRAAGAEKMIQEG